MPVDPFRREPEISGTPPLERSRTWRAHVQTGVVLAASEAGETGGPVALLHGGVSNRRWWDAVAGRLAESHHVLWWDHRAHGDSSRGAGACTVERLAQDTIALLRQRELENVVLVGHSLGAAVALTAAAHDCERIAAVVCVDGGIYDPRLLFGAAWAQARDRLCASRRPVSERLLAAWVDGAGLPPEALPAVLGNFADAGDGQLVLRVPLDVEHALAHSLWSQDLVDVLRRVDVPVTVIAADGDRSTGLRRRAIEHARTVLGDRLTVQWVRGSHDLPLECPAAIAALVDEVVNGVHQEHVGASS